MKNSFYFLFLSVFFIQCGEGKNEEKKSSDENSVEENKIREESNEIIIQRLPENHFTMPIAHSDTVRFEKTSLELKLNDSLFLEGNYKMGESGMPIRFDAKKLMVKIPVAAKNNFYHQQIAVYLFEKQWHADSVQIGADIWMRMINPPKGKNWFVEIYRPGKSVSTLLDAFSVRLPFSFQQKLFSAVNPEAEKSLADFLFQTPGLEKIDYNKIRRMAKLYEGFTTSISELKMNMGHLENHFMIQKNRPDKLSYFTEKDFSVPDIQELGYVSSHFIHHSLSELYAPSTFSYKITYSVNDNIDSLLEMQIDFKTKTEVPTVRLVMGGINFKAIPRLKTDEYTTGAYLPIGFSYTKYHPFGYVFMGNMSGFWCDNTLGRNIDGVIIHFDKNSVSRMHIWLMGGDGLVPVGHYITNLEKLFEGGR